MNIERELNKSVWKKQLEKNKMLYPDERVVAFFANNFKEQNNYEKNVLDIGCGSGRNLIPALDYGFNCYGIDFNEECCITVKKTFEDRKGLKKIYFGDLKSVNLESDFYDVVLIYGVLFLNEYNEMRQLLSEIKRIMKKGGKMIVNFRAEDDYLNGKGKKIGDYSYILDESTGSYENAYYTFLSFDKASNLLKEHGFKILKYEKIEFYKNCLKEKHSWWIFTVEA